MIKNMNPQNIMKKDIMFEKWISNNFQTCFNFNWFRITFYFG